MINVLFCGNDKVFDGMLTCSLSILKRSRTDEPITFYIYTMDVSHIKPQYLPVESLHLTPGKEFGNGLAVAVVLRILAPADLLRKGGTAQK